MSFFKRIGKSKTAEFPEAGEEKKKSRKGRRGGSLHLNSSRPREEDQIDGDVLRTVEEEKEKEKERKKYKDMSGILVGQQESVEYPNFVVHYLGRIPTSSEYMYGREAVEEPVNQLCKLREKQKLQKVYLSFNVEGLFCREISSGPFSKHKKDGFNMHIPLHHITYGVGCAAHPTVFACVAKMNDDPNPSNQVLVLHGFLCDKPETTQAITYWQLQAYIEAYEDLKRKRILRSRRKQAFEGAVVPPEEKNGSDLADRSKTVSEEGDQKDSSSRKSKKHSSDKRPTKNNFQPKIVEAPIGIPKEVLISNETESASSAPAAAPIAFRYSEPDQRQVPVASKSSEPDRPVVPVASKSSEPDRPVVPVASKSSEPDRHAVPVASKISEPDRPHLPRRQLHSGKPHQEEAPHHQQTTAVEVHPPGSHPHQRSSETNSPHSANHKAHHRGGRKSSSNSIGSAGGASYASSSGSSGHGDGSPVVSPASAGKATANKTFEKRIGELNTLVNMDAEKLKMLMINDHPTLARRIYYRATVDDSGVFHQDEEEDEDSHA